MRLAPNQTPLPYDRQVVRPVALVLHDDGELLDLLTRLLEANGLDVVAAVSTYRAQAHLEGTRPTDVVVAPWDERHAIGGELYRWILVRRADLRSRCVFVGEGEPAGFEVVAGRCLQVPASEPDELVRVVRAIARRTETGPIRVPVPVDPGKPSLLLVDDDPPLLEAMAGLLGDAGYAVAPAGEVARAVELLDEREFDAIVTAWRLHDGSDGAVYRWLAAHKPHLAERVVILADGELDDARAVAPDRPIVRRGQDFHALAEALRAIAGS